VSRIFASCVLVICFVVGCTASATTSPGSSAPAVEQPADPSATGYRPSSSTQASVTPIPAPSAAPLVTPMPAPSATPLVAPSSAPVPTAAPSPMVRVLGLDAILEIPESDRFETFGGEPIRLEPVWSPADLGIGGTCLPSDAWLECGLQDWIIQPSRELDPGDYGGPTLDLFFGPGVRERLGRDLRHGEGPFAVVGQFGDPASHECRPEDRDECRDLFVVSAIDLGDERD
jgi:hypothetical protein